MVMFTMLLKSAHFNYWCFPDQLSFIRTVGSLRFVASDFTSDVSVSSQTFYTFLLEISEMVTLF